MGWILSFTPIFTFTWLGTATWILALIYTRSLLLTEVTHTQGFRVMALFYLVAVHCNLALLILHQGINNSIHNKMTNYLSLCFHCLASSHHFLHTRNSHCINTNMITNLAGKWRHVKWRYDSSRRNFLRWTYKRKIYSKIRKLPDYMAFLSWLFALFPLSNFAENLLRRSKWTYRQ
jgi:hypothetical protein